MNLCLDATVRVYAKTPAHMERFLASAREALGDDFRGWSNKTPADMEIGELMYYAMSECYDERDFLSAALADPDSGLSVSFVIGNDTVKTENDEVQS